MKMAWRKPGLHTHTSQGCAPPSRSILFFSQRIDSNTEFLFRKEGGAGGVVQVLESLPS
jgi:hypothetical protein